MAPSESGSAMDVAALAISPTSYTSDRLLVIILNLEPPMTSTLSKTAVRRSCFGEEIGSEEASITYSKASRS